MNKWVKYGILILVALGGLWGAHQLYKSILLARQAAEEAEARTEHVRDSTRAVIEGTHKEIRAAQERIIALTESTVELEKELQVKIGETDESLDELEAAVPDTLRSLVRRLRSTITDERLVWRAKEDSFKAIIFQKDRQLEQKDVRILADSLLIFTQDDEIGKWKKAANASFKFNVGSTVVTAGATALVTLLLVTAAK